MLYLLHQKLRHFMYHGLHTGECCGQGLPLELDEICDNPWVVASTFFGILYSQSLTARLWL